MTGEGRFGRLEPKPVFNISWTEQVARLRSYATWWSLVARFLSYRQDGRAVATMLPPDAHGVPVHQAPGEASAVPDGRP
jgi:hypothetical protein